MNDIVQHQRRGRATLNGSAALELERLMDEWKLVVIDYEHQALAVGEAEANYKMHRKSWIKQAQIKDPKLSSAKASDWADADDEISNDFLSYRLEEARLDAMKQKLFWFKAEFERLRSVQVTQRDEARLDSQYQPG